MKKIILYGLIIVGLSACKKSKIDPDNFPDARLGKALGEYQTQLAGAKNGWIGYLYPKGGGGYTFKFKFDDKNRVVTYATINDETATTPMESSYRLKATQLPSLYFDTYTYLHTLADPDPEISGGGSGVGKESDFEFSFLTASADTIKLEGNLNESSLILVRAKDTEGDDYISRAYSNITTISKVNNFQYYYKKLTLGGKDYNVTINTLASTISFYYNDNGFKRFTTEYAAGATGIQLRTPFVTGTASISELHDFNINVAAGTVEAFSGTTKLLITNVATPLTFDKDAPTKFYTNKYTYTSDFGFTINGVENAHGVNALPGYVGMQFTANFYSDPFDVLWFYYNGGATRYGPIFNTRLTADGKAVFVKSPYGNQGTNPGTAGVASVNKVYNQLAEVGGYYAFETGVNSYDLVSVTDSKNWIRFY